MGAMNLRVPGSSALVCAITAYGLGPLAVLAMVTTDEMGGGSGGWFAIGVWGTFAVSVLDLVALAGGIHGLIKARRSTPPIGVGRSAVAIVMGLLGLIGAFVLLLLTALAIPTPH